MWAGGWKDSPWAIKRELHTEKQKPMLPGQDFFFFFSPTTAQVINSHFYFWICFICGKASWPIPHGLSSVPRASSFFFFLKHVNNCIHQLWLSVSCLSVRFVLLHFLDINGFQSPLHSALVNYLIPKRQLNFLVQHLRGVPGEAGPCLQPATFLACLVGTQLGTCWEQFHFTLCSSCPQLSQEVFLGGGGGVPGVLWPKSGRKFAFFGEYLVSASRQVLRQKTKQCPFLVNLLFLAQLIWEGRHPYYCRHTYLGLTTLKVDVIRGYTHTHLQTWFWHVACCKTVTLWS